MNQRHVLARNMTQWTRPPTFPPRHPTSLRTVAMGVVGAAPEST